MTATIHRFRPPVAPPRPSRRRAAPTWPELVAIEPRLGELLAEIKALRGDDPHFCAIKAWFGPGGRGGIKHRMEALVGWWAERDDPTLRSDRADRVAYRPLYDALPPCQDCVYGAVARALYGADRTP